MVFFSTKNILSILIVLWLSVIDLLGTIRKVKIFTSNNLDSIPAAVEVGYNVILDFNCQYDANPESLTDDFFYQHPFDTPKVQEAIVELYLNQNNLTHIPSSIIFLTNLTKLYAAGNLLEKLPDAIDTLVCLKYIDLSFNNFQSLPSEVLRMHNLKIIFFAQTTFDPTTEQGHIWTIEDFDKETKERVCALQQHGISFKLETTIPLPAPGRRVPDV